LAKGDFETALGGASHMGLKDIADLLVSHGARMDIFNFTFLGFTDFVKELLDKQPQLLNSYGPHGFTLLHHAKVGGHTVFASWLKEQGLIKEIFDDIFDW
jgi:ankyrin repeat protein